MAKKKRKKNKILKQKLRIMEGQYRAHLEEELINAQYSVGYYSVMKPKIDSLLDGMLIRRLL